MLRVNLDLKSQSHSDFEAVRAVVLCSIATHVDLDQYTKLGIMS